MWVEVGQGKLLLCLLGPNLFAKASTRSPAVASCVCSNKEGLLSRSLQLGPSSCSQGTAGLWAVGDHPRLSQGTRRLWGSPGLSSRGWWSFCLQYLKCQPPKIYMHSADA